MFGCLLRRGAIAAPRNLARSTVNFTSISSTRAIARTVLVQPSLRRTLTTTIPRKQYEQERAAQEPAYDGPEPVNETVLPTDNESVATTFQQLGERRHVHPSLLRSIVDDMGMSTMYPVQQETMNAALTGRDVIAQARTGTGKTLAFLLPIMQHILKEDPQLAVRNRKRVYANDIRGIVISPTRELAEQIAHEAAKLARHTGIVVQLAVGGTQKGLMLRKTQFEGCHLLVGTPGRLKDILSDSSTGIEAPKLTTFVLDEADRLLDAGFLPEIEEIKRIIPDLLADNRQTMMMSATISHEVVDLVRNTLQPGFKFVQCVDPNEAPTHDRIPQHVVVAPSLENIYPAIYELLQREMQAWKTGDARPLKVLAFFNSGHEAILAARVFQHLLRNNPDFRQTQVSQIHSKLSQAQRTMASDRFRRSQSGILMSTDVTARGLDFPDVTHVIQIGLPAHGGRESYIHRLGRTGRAGKEGEGWLFISKLEQSKGEHMLGDMPLKPDTSLKLARVPMGKEQEFDAETATVIQNFRDAFAAAAPEDLDSVYRAYLGSMQSYNSQDVVDQINSLATIGWGLPQPPPVSPTLASKLGYGRTRGLVLGSSGFGGSSGSFGGSGYGNSFGGRGGGYNSSPGGRDNYSGGFGRRDGGSGDRDGNSRGFGGSRHGGGRQHSSGYGGNNSYGNDGGYGGDRRASFGQ